MEVSIFTVMTLKVLATVRPYALDRTLSLEYFALWKMALGTTFITLSSLFVLG